MRIRAVTSDDAAKVCSIYNHYITNTEITFEEKPLQPEEMANRFAVIQKSGLPWIVAESDNHLLGYAYASRWHERSAYRHAVENSIYLAPEATGMGTGKMLMLELIELLRQKNIVNIVAVIALPNDRSVGLHESVGFNQVGMFPKIGFKFERWISVGYWLLRFEDVLR